MSQLLRMLEAECLLWLFALLLAPLFYFFPPCRRLAFRIESFARRLARRPTRCFAGIFLGATLFRLCLLPLLPVPVPSAHDEYSNLFAADTFHELRLTNPTPPVPVAFESFHVNVTPTYQSMYQPGGGLLLAVGDFLGHPWIAVLLSTALMCAVIYWALAGWLPPAWALLGGCIAIFEFCGFNWWINSYFMPQPAAIGGALLLGTLPRIANGPKLRLSLLFALGLSLLL